jgi:hypothetical protein
MGKMEKMVWMENLVWTGSQARMESSWNHLQPRSPASSVLLVQWVQWVRWETRVLRVPRDPLVKMGLLEPRESRECREAKEWLVLWDPQDLLDSREILEKSSRSQAIQVLLGKQGPKEKKVQLGTLAQMGCLEILECKESREMSETRERLGNQEQKVPQETMVQWDLVGLASTVHLLVFLQATRSKWKEKNLLGIFRG